MANAGTIHVLSSPQQASDENSLTLLAEFMGLQVRILCAPPDRHPTKTEAIHIAATCESLEAFLRHPLGRAWLRESLAAKGSTFFLTGFFPSSACLATTDSVLPGIVNNVRPLSDSRSVYKFVAAPSAGLAPFDGLTFGPVDTEADAVFELNPSAADASHLITIDDQPCYIRVERGASYFLLACTDVLDIDAAAHRVQPVNRLLRCVPFLGYLRSTFGARCWTNDAPRACFIIDDPLLKHRYGFLNFDDLQRRMAQSPFSVNVAFIPWNRYRTDSEIAAMVAASGGRLSISIHGCDHSEAEFGVTDESRLAELSRSALARMAVHEKLTGITHNRVMIFPQGVFSRASLRVLEEQGFVAAVNSTLYPVDGGADEITFRDLMDVACARFGGVPLFLRHYPRRLEQLALDVLLGRQVLIVEHHGFFKRGYEDLERCAAFVNRIAPEVRWTDVHDVCTFASLMREMSADEIEVRAFGTALRLTNSRETTVRFHIVPPHGTRDSAVREVVLEPHQEATIGFPRHTQAVRPADAPVAVGQRLKVFARRHLSEFRDNYLDRSAALSELARLGKSLLPRM